MPAPNFSTFFLLDHLPNETFDILKDVRGWWSGLYAEEITGSADQLGDEFTFRAGGGKHYSKQKLIEAIPGQKLVWLVTDSNLSFLTKADEWTGTKLSFEISGQGEKSQVHFTHIGLTPDIECYDGCSSTWPKYFRKLFSSPVNEIKEKTV